MDDICHTATKHGLSPASSHKGSDASSPPRETPARGSNSSPQFSRRSDRSEEGAAPPAKRLRVLSSEQFTYPHWPGGSSHSEADPKPLPPIVTREEHEDDQRLELKAAKCSGDHPYYLGGASEESNAGNNRTVFHNRPYGGMGGNSALRQGGHDSGSSGYGMPVSAPTFAYSESFHGPYGQSGSMQASTSLQRPTYPPGTVGLSPGAASTGYLPSGSGLESPHVGAPAAGVEYATTAYPPPHPAAAHSFGSAFASSGGAAGLAVPSASSPVSSAEPKPASAAPQTSSWSQHDAVPRRRGKLPQTVTNILKTWLMAHTGHPYPTEEEKKMLCEQTSLTMNQVSNWFINARRRILVPPTGGSSVHEVRQPARRQAQSQLARAAAQAGVSPPGLHMQPRPTQPPHSGYTMLAPATQRAPTSAFDFRFTVSSHNANPSVSATRPVSSGPGSSVPWSDVPNRPSSSPQATYSTSNPAYQYTGQNSHAYDSISQARGGAAPYYSTQSTSYNGSAPGQQFSFQQPNYPPSAYPGNAAEKYRGS